MSDQSCNDVNTQEHSPCAGGIATPPLSRMTLGPPSFHRHESSRWVDSWKNNEEDWGAQTFNRNGLARTSLQSTETRLNSKVDISNPFDDQQRIEDHGHREWSKDLSVDIQQQHAILEHILLEADQNKKMKADTFDDHEDLLRGAKRLTVHSPSPPSPPLSSNVTLSTYASSSNASLSARSSGVYDSLTSSFSTDRRGSRCGSPSLSDSSLEEDPLLQYCNPAALEEQRCIMEQIERDKHEKQQPLRCHQQGGDYSEYSATSTPAQTRWSPPESCARVEHIKSDELSQTNLYQQGLARKSRRTVAATVAQSNRLSTRTARNMLRREASSKDDKANAFRQNTTTTFYGGKKLNVRGTEKTLEDIAQGDAVIVRCPACRTMLQVSKKAKLIYCTQCQAVSSMDLVKGVTGDDDSRIASDVQKQEMERALVRKMTTSRRSRR